MPLRPLLAGLPVALLLVTTLTSRMNTAPRPKVNAHHSEEHLTQLAGELYQLSRGELERRLGPPTKRGKSLSNQWRAYSQNGLDVTVRFGDKATPEQVCVSSVTPDQESLVGHWPPLKAAVPQAQVPSQETPLRDTAI